MTDSAEMGVQRILIVGAGSIAAAHVDVATKWFSGAEIHAADVSPEATRRLVDRFMHVRSHPSVQEMLAVPARAGDVVVIATPPRWHAELALAAFRSGRHVLCEKPLAMTTAEAQQMRDAARAAGRLLGCCSSRFTGSAPARTARQLVIEGKLGGELHVTWVHRQHRGRTGIEYQPSTSWFLKRSINGGGVLMDWGPYDASALCDMLKPKRAVVEAAWVAAPKTRHPAEIAAEPDVESQVSARLLFESDAGLIRVGYERAACTHGHELSVNEIEGCDGAVTWNWLTWNEAPPVQRTFDVDGKLTTESVPVGPFDGVTPHDRPLLYFDRALRGLPHHGVHDDDAVFNFSVLRAIYDCAAAGSPTTVVRA